MDYSGSVQGLKFGFCKLSNETSDFITRVKFPDWISDYQLTKDNSAPIYCTRGTHSGINITVSYK